MSVKCSAEHPASRTSVFLLHHRNRDGCFARTHRNAQAAVMFEYFVFLLEGTIYKPTQTASSSRNAQPQLTATIPSSNQQHTLPNSVHAPPLVILAEAQKPFLGPVLGSPVAPSILHSGGKQHTREVGVREQRKLRQHMRMFVLNELSTLYCSKKHA